MHRGKLNISLKNPSDAGVHADEVKNNNNNNKVIIDSLVMVHPKNATFDNSHVPGPDCMVLEGVKDMS